jgi:hypothetical protein
MVETATLIAASSVGLAIDGETVTYVSGWGEDGALEAVTEFAETIDRVARQIEDVLMCAHEGPEASLAGPVTKGLGHGFREERD